MSAVILRRGVRRQLSLLSSVLSAHRGLACRVSAPAAAEMVTSAVSCPAPAVVVSRHQPAPLGGARGFAAGSGLAGGAFVIRRVPQAAVPSLPSDGSGSAGAGLSGVRCSSAAALPQPPSPGRGLTTSSMRQCNLATGGGFSDFEEAPFGHPAPSFAASAAAQPLSDASESESEDDDVAIAQVGGHILYGKPRVSRSSRSQRKPVEQMEARWIGSASHSGDWSRASTVKPVAEPAATVWAQILAACREDPAQLKSTVAMLYAAFEQSAMVPPLPAFNKLLELCSKQPDAMDTVHQLVNMLDSSELCANEETQKQLDACFAYNNRERS